MSQPGAGDTSVIVCRDAERDRAGRHEWIERLARTRSVAVWNARGRRGLERRLQGPAHLIGEGRGIHLALRLAALHRDQVRSVVLAPRHWPARVPAIRSPVLFVVDGARLAVARRLTARLPDARIAQLSPGDEEAWQEVVLQFFDFVERGRIRRAPG